jgi:hypothetical protein
MRKLLASIAYSVLSSCSVIPRRISNEGCHGDTSLVIGILRCALKYVALTLKSFITRGEDCYARILHRGEQLFYQYGDRTIICEISVTEGLLDLKSIKRWDHGSKRTDAERESIKKCLGNFFQYSPRTKTQLICAG